MDTRNKIIPLAEAAAVLANGEWIVVAGRFDPMTVFEAERLAELGQDRKLLAVVLEEHGALLGSYARAALVAALRGVQAVTIGPPEGWRAILRKPAGVRIVDDPAADAARRNSFIEMVVSKQQLR